jgi:hypothetical protein
MYEAKIIRRISNDDENVFIATILDVFRSHLFAPLKVSATLIFIPHKKCLSLN